MARAGHARPQHLQRFSSAEIAAQPMISAD
jgi:hypothetical protein